LVAGAAKAGGAAVDPTGVWRGTLADRPALACFASASAGEYYELLHAETVALRARSAGFLEGGGDEAAATRWERLVREGDTLRGARIPPAPGQPEPIRLQRIGEPDAEADCRTLAFNQPRLDVTSVELGGVRRDHGLAVRTLSAFDGDVTGLQVAREDAPARRLNATLRAEFDDALIDHFDCGKSDDGLDDYLWSRSADAIRRSDARWVSIAQETRWYCGGLHGQARHVLTYDRRTGAAIEPADWLQGSPWQWPRPFLDALLARAAKVPRHEDEWKAFDCDDAWRGVGFSVWPGDGGLWFAPYSVEQCYAEVFVPMAELQPHLSAAGRETLGIEPAPHTPEP
jgi:hypothetical protein